MHKRLGIRLAGEDLKEYYLGGRLCGVRGTHYGFLFKEKYVRGWFGTVLDIFKRLEKILAFLSSYLYTYR
jgi:hypothetical protein